MIRLKTRRLELRHLRSEDIPEFFAYRSDVETNRLQGWIPHTLKDARDFFDNSIRQIPDIPATWVQLAILERQQHKLIGDIGIYFSPDDPHEVKFGYTLAKEYHGCGYATEAMTALIDYLYQTMNKTRFIALIAPDNLPSIRLATRLGFILSESETESEPDDGVNPRDLMFVLAK